MYGMFTVYIRSCDAMLYSLDMIHVCRPRNLGRTSDTTFFLNSCVGSRVGFSCMGGPCPRCQRAWEGPLGEICSLCRGLQRLFNLVQSPDNSDELRVALLSRVRTWAGETQDLLEQFEENASRRQCLRGKSTAPQPPEGLVQAARPLPSPQGEASLPRAEAPHPAREEVEVKEEREDRPRHKSEEDKPERKEKAQGSRRTLEKGERKRKERSQSREKARGHRKDTRSESEKRSEDAPDSKRGKEKKERPSPHEGRDYREVARSLTPPDYGGETSEYEEVFTESEADRREVEHSKPRGTGERPDRNREAYKGESHHHRGGHSDKQRKRKKKNKGKKKREEQRAWWANYHRGPRRY